MATWQPCLSIRQIAFILRCNKNKTIQGSVSMLQASLYAGRHAAACPTPSAPSATAARRSGPTQLISALFTFGQNWLQGGPSDTLSSHLLQDIGVSRADLEAMKL